MQSVGSIPGTESLQSRRAFAAAGLVAEATVVVAVAEAGVTKSVASTAFKALPPVMEGRHIAAAQWLLRDVRYLVELGPVPEHSKGQA